MGRSAFPRNSHDQIAHVDTSRGPFVRSMSVTAHSSFPIRGTSALRAYLNTWALRPPAAQATSSLSGGETKQLTVTR